MQKEQNRKQENEKFIENVDFRTNLGIFGLIWTDPTGPDWSENG